MKKFETPEIEVVEFAVEDIITESTTEQTFIVIDGEPCIS